MAEKNGEVRTWLMKIGGGDGVSGSGFQIEDGMTHVFRLRRLVFIAAERVVGVCGAYAAKRELGSAVCIGGWHGRLKDEMAIKNAHPTTARIGSGAGR